MHIQEEKANNHSVLSYSNTHLQIQQICYIRNILVSAEAILCPWKIASLNALCPERLIQQLSKKPEILLIGQPSPAPLPSSKLLWSFNALHIALESMSIGSACSTYNILLGEGRAVVLGIIF